MTRTKWEGTGTIVLDLDDDGLRIVTMAHPPKGMVQMLTDAAGRLVMCELRDILVLSNLGDMLVAVGESAQRTPLLNQKARLTP